MGGEAWQVTVQGNHKVSEGTHMMPTHTYSDSQPLVFHHIRCCSFDPNMDWSM